MPRWMTRWEGPLIGQKGRTFKISHDEEYAVSVERGRGFMVYGSACRKQADVHSLPRLAKKLARPWAVVIDLYTDHVIGSEQKPLDSVSEFRWKGQERVLI